MIAIDIYDSRTVREEMPSLAPTRAHLRHSPEFTAAGNPARRPHPITMLAQIPFFASLEPSDLRDLADSCRQRTFQPGQPLFYEGDPGATLYILQSGRVKIVRDLEEGEEAILHISGPGEYLGEMALLDGQPRSATATALEVVKALTLDRETFLALLARRPAVALSIMSELAQRVRRVTQQFQDAISLDVPGRLARTLLLLADRYGETDGGGIRIRLRLTQAELAQMIGVARPTVATHLGSLRKRGIVSIDREGITIHRPDPLRQRIY